MNTIKHDAPKRRHKRKESSITQAQALAILQSALRYCQQSGLVVRLDTTPEGLTLTLPGAVYEMTTEGARFTLTESGRITAITEGSKPQ